VLSVCFLFFDRGESVCVFVCVYTHTHTHTAHGVLGCEPRLRGWYETMRGPKESRRTESLHLYIRICVLSKNVRICSGRLDEILDCLLFYVPEFSF